MAQPKPSLKLPSDLDALDMGMYEMKGCIGPIAVEYDGSCFEVEFYDPIRFAQTLASELDQYPSTLSPPNTIIVSAVTPAQMQAAVEDQARRDGFRDMTPIEPR